MSTITVPVASATPAVGVRTGLAISAVLGLGNLPFLWSGIDWGTKTPPFGLLLLNAAIGMVSVFCAVLAWNTGDRRAIRIDAAALILNALTVLPGLFGGTSAFITIVTAVIIVGTLVSVVLMMRREPADVRTID